MDAELKKLLSLLRNKGALVNGVPVSETFVSTTDSLENIRDELVVADAAVDAVQADVGNPSVRVNFPSLETMIGVPDAANSNLDDILRTGFDSSAIAANENGSLAERLEQIQEAVNVGTGTSLPANKSLYDGLTGGIDAVDRAAGKAQIIEVSITSAANAGNVTVATITTQPCLIKSLVIHADTAAQADLTSAAVYAGAANINTVISATEAAVANLNQIDEQVGWTGAIRLAATKTIVIDLLGTGVTAVDLTVTIEYEACVDGGYLA